MSELTPTAGARFLLERIGSGDGARAEYRAAIFTPDATFDGRAVLDESGAVQLELVAPDDLRAGLEMFAKLVARGATKKREDGLTAWPARLLRWRPR